MSRCPPELGRHPFDGELLNGKPMCNAHYCAWCCGCGVCMAADREWQRRNAQPAPSESPDTGNP